MPEAQGSGGAGGRADDVEAVQLAAADDRLSSAWGERDAEP